MAERRSGRKAAVSTEHVQAPAAARTIVPVEGPSIPTYYANNVSTSLSIWDVRLEFGLVQGQQQDRLLVQPLARIMLSPQHLKAVASLLDRLVERYERDFGHIQMPSDVTRDTSAPED